jgi:hypothetical protein
MSDQHIRNWIENLSKPKEKLNGFPICPYAKNAKYNIVETTLDNIDPPPWEFDLYIFVIKDTVTIEQLSSRCKELETIYPGMIFLPDHKDRNTFINGEKTNNGILNLILCQWADDLHEARKKLANTSYYDLWDSNYLEEILGIN